MCIYLTYAADTVAHVCVLCVHTLGNATVHQMKHFLPLCPLPVFLDFTSTPSHLCELGVLSSLHTLGELTCEGEKSHFSPAVAAVMPGSVQTLKGPVRASCFQFWAKVQLSLGLGSVKSFA